jgi:hypothetical protein
MTCEQCKDKDAALAANAEVVDAARELFSAMAEDNDLVYAGAYDKLREKLAAVEGGG